MTVFHCPIIIDDDFNCFVVFVVSDGSASTLVPKMQSKKGSQVRKLITNFGKVLFYGTCNG